jgi:dTDP-4-dehydrorhamnose reductase
MTDVDGCERNPAAAKKANVDTTRNLVSALGEDSRFLFVSTDYVFDGKNGPYRENDPVNPVCVYGRSKLEAEDIVRQAPQSLVVRTIVLFGTGERLRPYFPDWVLGKLSSGEKMRVVDDQSGNTTLASNLAGMCRALIENRATGLYHAAGNEIVSRCEFARRIARFFGCNEDLISSCKTGEIKQAALRPLRSGFVLDKIGAVPGVRLLDVDGQLRQFKAEKQDHAGRS